LIHHRGRRRAAAIAPLCLVVAGLLAGCSTSDGVGAFIIDPGHYSVYHCDGLAARLKVLLVREQELSNLMERASEGGGGVLIGNLSYRADYENAVGEEKVLRRTAAEKKCELPPPAAPVSPTPAAYTAPPAPAAPPGAPIFQSDQTIR
jgi:predicted small secreted protein